MSPPLREAVLQADVLLKWGAHPQVRLWRANAGKAWVPTGGGTGFRPIQVNVPGCPDLIGWISVAGVARFLGVETKSPIGKLRESQERFRAVLERMGGVYVVARSVKDVDQALAPLVAA